MIEKPGHSSVSRILATAVLAAIGAAGIVRVHAQIPGRNVNMVSGDTLPDGDPYLQRQNEPSIAASTRNPLHLLGGANDYRTVDLPGLPDGQETGDAWVGLFKSTDGGQRWKSTLVPGYPQDQSLPASPLKGYQAAADPVVRAGTNGLFYYSGLVFNRTDEKSAIFVARFIDNNNTENGDPIAYLGTTIVASSPGVRFLDKPWIAVDIPRPGGAMCTIPAPNGATQRIAAGAVYVSWSSITGTGTALKSQILFTRSVDCGVTWSAPAILSRPQDQINQGSTIAIDPRTGAVIVAWRRFATPGATDGDALTVARSQDFGRKFDQWDAHRFPKRDKKMTLPPWVFEHRGKDKDRDDYDDDDDNRGRKNSKAPKFRKAQTIDPLAAFDEPSGSDRFRTNGYPTMAIDDSGRVYVAWTERGYSTIPGRTSPVDGDAKIVMTTSSNGSTWRAPLAVSEPSQPGHQFMPSLTFAGGRLLLVYYDLRDDVSQTLSQFADDTSAYPSGHRRTMDIRASMAAPGLTPVFAPSVKVSNYAMGSRLGSTAIEQMQFNPPNLPMFKLGTVPFVGDYIDVSPAPAFVPDGHGGWAYNTAGGSTLPTFQAVWTDNRDVRVPPDGDWTHYTPPFSSSHSPLTGAVCDPGFTASRNQNIYTSRITGGLLVGSPGNTKPLSPTLQRAFVVFAQNTSATIKTFRMTIAAQPVGGYASFSQFTPPTAPLTSIDVTTAGFSMAARSVYATSSNPKTQLVVNVQEIAAIGGAPTAAGLTGAVVLNPDIQNPDIQNPDIQNNGIVNPNIQNAEVYNPDIQNPDIQNPDIQNPDIQNPDIQNPDIQNVVLANPDIQNALVANPDIQNPDIQNPDIQNPDIQNPDIQNGALTDVTWTMTNTGNTTTAYNVNLFLTSAQVPAGFKFQLILHKTYTTPVALGCDLKTQTQNVVVANILNPQFADASTSQLLDQNDPRVTNPTLWLAPGEVGKITLRIVDPDRSNNVTTPDGVSIDPAFNPQETVVTPILTAQPVGTPDIALGQTHPPIVTPNNSSLLFLAQPSSGFVGQAISPAVRIQVRDTSGAVVPGVPVTLALGNNPGGAVLTGGIALSDVTGIASFGGLTLDKVGSGYTLVATVGLSGLLPSTSVPFDVKGVVVPVSGAAGGTENINFHDGAAGALGIVPASTGVFVPAGQSVTVSASGTWTFGAPTGPGGIGEIAGAEFLAPGATKFALVGRVGPDSPWQLIGDGPTSIVAPVSGFLELALNDDWYGDNGGNITATIIPPASGAAQVVTNTADSGAGSLRAAITAANAAVTPQGIAFNIPGSAPFTVSLLTPLPAVTQTTVIDGSTQPGYGGTPIVMLKAEALPLNSSAITIAATAPSSTVRGLIINGAAAGTSSAITLLGAGSRVYGTFLGTDETGLAALPNYTGVAVASDTNTIGGVLPSQRNVIAGSEQGVWIQGGSGNTIAGNRIGTDLAGEDPLGNNSGVLVSGGANATIGGSLPLQRNLLSGNVVGVYVKGGSGVTIQGNWIGTDATGSYAIHNSAHGISLQTGTSSAIGIFNNLIAGNAQSGIDIDAATGTTDGTSIIGNTIGLNAFGAALPNLTGVSVANGATTQVLSNTIADNSGAGVTVRNLSTGVTVRQNSIYGNGLQGIDLGGDGPTANDAGDNDTGPNGLQNYPVLASAYDNGNISFTIDSAPGVYWVDFFSTPSCGQGAVYLGSTTAAPGAATATLGGLADGTLITATATSPGGSTSEFSSCVAVTAPPPPPPPPPPAFTVVGPAGGFGGSPFTPVDCATGSAVIGFVGRAGDDIDQTQLLCAPLPALTPATTLFVAGGSGGNDYAGTLTCGAGEAVTGVFGGIRNGNQWIDYIGVVCTNLTTAASHNAGPVALNQGGTPFTLSCPANTVVTGVEGRQGLLMDQISLHCK